MKTYNSIDNKIIYDEIFMVFDKLDGSNIRAEWNKKGFYKFGSRKCLIDSSTPILGESIEIIQDKYSSKLSKIFKKNKYESVTCFFEFFGKNSFAGSHVNEDHDVVLFDIDVYKKGIVEPLQFISLVNDLEYPGILYYDNITEDFVQSVKNRTLNGMTFEGVVCKRKYKNTIQMFKIKSNDWLDRLKNRCEDNISLYNMLK